MTSENILKCVLCNKADDDMDQSKNKNMLLRIYETLTFAGGGTLNKRCVCLGGWEGKSEMQSSSTEGLRADEEATRAGQRYADEATLLIER